MTTLFSWGYFGWGNSTPEMLRAADLVEAARGFAAPLFVDTRIRRSVRARGFQGAAFADLLGPRHVWMRRLGNEAILSGEGGFRISDPRAAADLLDLALADGRRRVVYFCSCQWPMLGGEPHCHRHVIGTLLLAEASRRGAGIEVVEWPGGEPASAEVEAPAAVVRAVRRGRAAVPLGTTMPGAGLCGLAWGSAVRVWGGGEEARVVAGPARHRAGAWELPVMRLGGTPEPTAAALGEAFGVTLRESLASPLADPRSGGGPA